MAEDKGRQLWAEDVGALLGVTARTVVFSASKTKRKAKAARTACDLPLPAGRRRRQVRTSQGKPRTVVSPWWHEADIMACRDARREAGVLDLDRGEGGRFAKAVGQ
jgi:hypothetical protein